MRAMLDTDTCIHAMRGSARFRPTLPLRECGISVIVRGELEYGVLRSGRVETNRIALDHFLAAVPVIGTDPPVGQTYGVLREHLSRAGNIIGPNDLWIAAHALVLDLPLISHNLSEFRRVPGLTVESWMTN